MQFEELVGRIEAGILDWAGGEDDFLGWHDHLVEVMGRRDSLDVFVVCAFDYSGMTRLWTHVVLEAGEWGFDDYAGKLARAAAEDLLERQDPGYGTVPEKLDYVYLEEWG